MLDAIISTTPYLFTKDLSNINFYANVKYMCSHFQNRVRSKLELPADLSDLPSTIRQVILMWCIAI